MADDVVEGVLAEEGVSASDLSAMAAEGWVRKQAASVRAHLVEDRFSPEREKARRRLYGFLARRGFVGESLRSGLEAGEEKARAMKDEARKAGG